MNFPDDEQREQGAPDPDEELVEDNDTPEHIADKLAIFGSRLSTLRDEWVRARAAQGHDRRWSLDLDQYNGKDAASQATPDMMSVVQQGGMPVQTSKSKSVRSTVFVQVTRQKTNSMAARWADIVCPTDERNFGIQATPIPGLPSFVQVAPQAADSGPAAPTAAPAAAPQTPPAGAPPIGGPQPAAGGAPSAPGGQGGGAALQMAPVSAAVQQLLDQQAEAHRRAERMQQAIQDAFDECDMPAEDRKCLFNASLFGAGVKKGPVVVNRTRKAWAKRVDASGAETWVMDTVDELAPASFSIDPRYCWPDPQCGESVQNGRGFFELDRKTGKQVRGLRKQPAYIREQLDQVIESGPQSQKCPALLDAREDRDLAPGDLYEHWIYWGEIDRDDLEAAGVTLPDDEMDVVSACVEMINSTVVRAYINPLADGAIPYDIVPCERIPGSVWGYGVPYLMRSQQQVINSAWRMLLDNAGISSGPQIIMKPGAVQPANKDFSITPRKVWYAMDDVDDVTKVFTSVEFNSHQAELSAILDLADRLADQETAVPMLSQGQQGSAPETVGGMQILMQGANVMLRRLVKHYDDYITKQHVRRYYNYEMEYGEDAECKGDFNIVALGSSALVVRDIQNQAYTNLLAMGTNPAYAPLINLKNLFTKALEAQHIDPHDVMNTDQEIQAALQRAAQQQPDPRVVAAQMRSEADKERTQAQMAMSQQTLAAKAQQGDADRQVQLSVAQLSAETEKEKIAQHAQQAIDTHRVSLATTGITERSKQDMQARELSMAAATNPAQ